MSFCRSEVISRQSLRLTVSAVLLEQLYMIWSGLAAESFSIAKWLLIFFLYLTIFFVSCFLIIIYFLLNV
jgi:hypothetical protein